MNGAELLMKTAKNAGIEVCFTNFGTTEVPLASAFDTEPGIKPIMGLFEGVCTGAADGWGRMKDKPAMTLLHLGPGLANGLSTLQDARRAQTPLVNIVGEHMSWHVSADPPLAMNIEALAGTVSKWYRTVRSPGEISRDLAEGITAAMYGQIATLILPHDFQMANILGNDIAVPHFSFDSIDDKTIGKAVNLIRSYRKVGLILGGRALRRQGLEAASRIKDRINCDILMDVFPGYLDRGGNLPEVMRIPYFPEEAANFLSRYEAVVLAGARVPVSFFGHEGVPSYLIKEDQPKVQIATSKQNPVEALEYLAEALNAPQRKEATATVNDPPPPQGDLTADKACSTLAAVQPEGVIIVDEGLSSAFPCYAAAKESAPHTLLTIAGGSLGYGMPCSIGAAIACPDRPVINYQADGSAMYTVQALWTQARENLHITTLITSNHSYHILKIEMERANSPVGPNARSIMNLENPEVKWVKIAEGLGVPAVSVTTSEDLTREIKRSLSESGPHLIEMVFSG